MAKVLVTGATGYVGARLVPRLLAAGHEVRAAGRSLAKLRSRPWAASAGVELAVADVLDKGTLRSAMEGMDVVYYLVHSMGPGHGKDFAERDRRAAKNLVDVAAECGVKRIVYLGGLGDESAQLSEHLASRAEVGRILGSGPVPATVLRAAVILGAGSASFEILRYLVERLPIMITPRWVSTPLQPIAIRNVLGYLTGVLGVEETKGRVFDIGGPEVMTYERLMQIYAEEADLRPRVFVRVPVLTPKLSALWIRFITPAPSSLAIPLADGLRNPVVCEDDSIRKLVPQELLTAREAMRRAIDHTQHDAIESHWTDSGVMPPAAWAYHGDAPWSGGTVLTHEREVHVAAPVDALWSRVQRIGGEVGYYWGNPLWRLRGAIDRLLGGVGTRRGRASPTRLRPGDALDFWRVVDVDPGRAVRLAAEMRLPGRAILEFRVQPEADGSRLQQRASFLPRGLLGIVYWYALEPIHAILFRGMAKAIARAAEEVAEAGPRAIPGRAI